MVRERLNAIDVAAVVGNLQKSIVDYNLVNIYDVNSRVYVLKFSRNEDKKFVMFEIGHRIHTTEFLRSSDKLPSNFNVKLRKHLRMRKLRAVSQVAQDRVVDFMFSAGEYAHHLIIQFFLPGNVYLTDSSYKVMAVLRPQNVGEVSFKVGTVYEIPETFVPWNVPLSYLEIDRGLRHLVEGGAAKETGEHQVDALQGVAKGTINKKESEHNGKGGKKQKGKKNENKGGKTEKAKEAKDPELIAAKDGEGEETGGSNITALIKSIFPSVHRSMVDHVIKTTVSDPAILSLDVCEIGREKLLELAETVRKAVQNVTHSDKIVPGFLLKGNTDHEDFSPFEIQGYQERFDDFNDALDAYFTKSDIKKIEKKETPKKPIKLKKIKEDQDRRENKLEQEIEKISAEILFIEMNQKVFDSTLDLLRTLIASGASWSEIMDQLALQRELGHPLAKHIRSVNIPDRRVELCLPSDDPEFYKETSAGDGKKNKKKSKKPEIEHEGADTRSAILDYGLTCFKNLEEMYSNKKRLAEKLGRTKIGREFALKRVDQQKEKTDKKAKGKHMPIRKVRKRLWFEKFHWFISSDGYLVLGGRDATQNELLVKRYLTKGDLYFHAEIHGAASCILKNPQQVEEVPNSTIEQAACFAVCLSNAWNNKMMIAAWWVRHDQVSRSAPTGEYLPHGSFMIRGKKNFVPAQRLEMAIGIVFQVANQDSQQELPLEGENEDQGEATPSVDDADPLMADQREPGNDAERTSASAEDSDIDENKNMEPNDTEEDKGSQDEYADEDADDHDTDSSEQPEQQLEDDGDLSDYGNRDPEENMDDSVDKETASLQENKWVRFDVDNIVVHDIEVENSQLKRTLERKATGLTCNGFDPSELIEKLSSMGFVEDTNQNFNLNSVRFIEPEAIEHSPETTKKLMQRMPTGLPVKGKKKRLSKTAAMKAARARQRYGEDDEETQELRLKLLGSKSLEQRDEKKTDNAKAHRHEANVPNVPVKKEEVKPLDDRELATHMRQFRNLSKNPGPDDVIVSAIPMCAPYSALKDHPYHIKLLPGHTKKGAISSLALRHFLDIDKTKEEQLRLITVDQFALALIENCKIPGGANEHKRG